MEYNELIETLKNIEAIAYGYNINGEVLGMDCSDFEQIMVDTADAITKLIARAETAEKQNTQLTKDLSSAMGMISNWSYNCKAAVERAQQFKSERDAAVSDLRGCAIESCAECMYCLYRTARSFCGDCTDGSNWRWQGAKEE